MVCNSPYLQPPAPPLSDLRICPNMSHPTCHQPPTHPHLFPGPAPIHFPSLVGPATHTCLEVPFTLSHLLSLCTWPCPCSANSSAPRRAPPCPPPSQPRRALLVQHLTGLCHPRAHSLQWREQCHLRGTRSGVCLGDPTNFNLRKKTKVSLFPSLRRGKTRVCTCAGLCTCMCDAEHRISERCASGIIRPHLLQPRVLTSWHPAPRVCSNPPQMLGRALTCLPVPSSVSVTSDPPWEAAEQREARESLAMAKAGHPQAS